MQFEILPESDDGLYYELQFGCKNNNTQAHFQKMAQASESNPEKAENEDMNENNNNNQENVIIEDKDKELKETEVKFNELNIGDNEEKTDGAILVEQNGLKSNPYLGDKQTFEQLKLLLSIITIIIKGEESSHVCLKTKKK